MRHEGQAVTRTAIVEQVWKLNFDTMTNVVDVYINYLRRKVDSGYDRPLIRTIRGVGYQIGGQSRPQLAPTPQLGPSKLALDPWPKGRRLLNGQGIGLPDGHLSRHLYC